MYFRPLIGGFHNSIYNDPRDLHSLKLTWHLKIGHPKRKVVFQPSIFRCYVSFREGILPDGFFRSVWFFWSRPPAWPQHRRPVLKHRILRRTFGSFVVDQLPNTNSLWMVGSWVLPFFWLVWIFCSSFFFDINLLYQEYRARRCWKVSRTGNLLGDVEQSDPDGPTGGCFRSPNFLDHQPA